jgi:hypothetical protein
LNQAPEEYLIKVIEEMYGTDTWNAILARVDEFYNSLGDQQVERTCASALKLRDGFLGTWKQAFRPGLLEYQAQFGECGTCDVLSEQFSKDIVTYLSNRIEIEMWELLEAVAGEKPLAQLYCLFKQLQAWDEIGRLGCSPWCVNNGGGMPFWIEYASYCLGVFGQQVINLAIAQGWITCP